MKVTGQEVIDDRYVVTTAYGRDIGLEGLENSAVVAVTDTEEDFYRCSDILPEQSMGEPLETATRYQELHGNETPDRPVDKQEVPHEQLQVVAETLSAEEVDVERKMQMLDHEESP